MLAPDAGAEDVRFPSPGIQELFRNLTGGGGAAQIRLPAVRSPRVDSASDRSSSLTMTGIGGGGLAPTSFCCGVVLVFVPLPEREGRER